MKPTISFLIGSGFSIPEGIPGIHQVNQRLAAIDESEIMIHSDQQAFFLDGQVDNNRHTNYYERYFVQEFLKFYNKEILSGKAFHYETFYDFYSDYLRQEGTNIPEIEAFVQRFNDEFVTNPVWKMDGRNYLSNFNRTFNQLLAQLLQKEKYYNDVTYTNYPLYDGFIYFLKGLAESNFEVKIHSLNHDIFLDFLGTNHSVTHSIFCDGYELAGSPFYGSLQHTFQSGVRKNYHVKLHHYTNRYKKSICFYKLHGSVATYTVYLQPEKEWVRLKSNYGISEFYMEIKDDKNEEYHFKWLHGEVPPDFLSGTTEKTRRYVEDPYYINLFKHFEDNLSASKLLFVIGYGFQDSGINDYLNRTFLQKGNKMIVIDPNKPESPLLEGENVIHVAKSIVDVDLQEFNSFLNN